MAVIDDLLAKIGDEALRTRIAQEVEKLSKQKKFGLVFEEHIPECTPLYDCPYKVGSRVAQKESAISDIYVVEALGSDDTVECVHTVSHERTTFKKDALVAVAEFGEAIYPYLKPVDSICNAPDSDLWHTLIEADNYHALQLLQYLYRGKVDCIYIDPPYNTGAKDWKYNNDYVDDADAYRHSKWLSMMARRLRLAKTLLNPKDSVLIVTIDEKEYLHLGCLLEELFPDARMQMVSSVINPSGVSRGDFYRTDEYLYFIKFGTSVPIPLNLSDEWITAQSTGKDKLRWRPIRRQGSHDNRTDAINQFYPIFLTPDGKHFAGVGETLPLSMTIDDFVAPRDKITLWPMKPNGKEGCWQISQDTFLKLCDKGYTKISYSEKWGYVVHYLAEGERKKVEKGQFPILGKAEDGSIITNNAIEEAPFVPGTQWRIHSHSAREFGSTYINKILHEKRFDFPKSLYAVHDALRFFVADKPNALVVDFFAGSGTTLHAVNLLNAEDGGQRRCIIVTNNEVSAREAASLTAQGYHRGDDEWERWGIARYVAWPRTVCSIEGNDVQGVPLRGTYLGGSGRAMADGFAANAVYFKMGFLDKTAVALGRQFRELLPLLWMKAGAIGRCPTLADGTEVPPLLLFPANRFAVLVDEREFKYFRLDMSNHSEITTVYFITDSGVAYQSMSKYFPHATSYQIYKDYLNTFQINTLDGQKS